MEQGVKNVKTVLVILLASRMNRNTRKALSTETTNVINFWECFSLSTLISILHVVLLLSKQKIIHR